MGCDARDNEAQKQKTRRPEGFRGKGRLAALLLSRRSMKDILLRRALPSSPSLENSTTPNFQTGSTEKQERIVPARFDFVADSADLLQVAVRVGDGGVVHRESRITAE